MYGDYGGLKKQLNKMDTLPINLIVFATTMGHEGRHTYGKVIDTLFSQLDPQLFANKVLHLKSREEELDIAVEIKDFCSEKNIRVIESKEEIVHHSENHLNHSAGYFKDIYKVYSDLELRKQKYSFWFEDDWLLNINSIDLEQALRESLDFLDDNPNQLCVRFNRSEKFDEPEGECLKKTENIFTQTENYSQYAPCFTFQPNVNRTSEFFLAWKTLQQHLHKLGSYHCELMATHLLREGFSNSKTPFSFFDPEKIYSQHIG